VLEKNSAFSSGLFQSFSKFDGWMYYMSCCSRSEESRRRHTTKFRSFFHGRRMQQEKGSGKPACSTKGVKKGGSGLSVTGMRRQRNTRAAKFTGAQ